MNTSVVSMNYRNILKMHDYTFLTGAPGSRWSGVAQIISENFNYNNSDVDISEFFKINVINQYNNISGIDIRRKFIDTLNFK